MKLINNAISIVLLIAFTFIMNAIQIALLIAAGPSLLEGATFAFATPLFWLCAIVYVGIFL